MNSVGGSMQRKCLLDTMRRGAGLLISMADVVNACLV